MSDPNNPTSGGSPSGPAIKIPAGVAPPPNPKKQTVRISTPPAPQASNLPTNPGATASLTPPTRPQTRQHHLTPSRMERILSFLMSHKWAITIILCIFAGCLAFWSYIPKEKSTSAAIIDAQIRKERDELKRQLALQEIEKARLTNEVVMLQKGLDQLADNIASNRAMAVMQQPRSNTPPSQPTNQAVIQTESPKNVGSGLVTVNENHGDIKIIIKNDDGEKSVRTAHGPDRAEDIVPGLAEATGTESPINTDKSVPSGGNGIRYYLPKGWSLNYKYYCSQEDFEVFVNKGTREVPKWEAIDVSIDGRSESLWIRNLSRRNVKLTFTLTPAKK